jgi:putative phosphonate metabolism protein
MTCSRFLKELHSKMNERPGNAFRYAIYFTPEEASPLHHLGSCWLGRDARTDCACTPALPDNISRDEWSQVTGSPRRYGFHATLKPPFKLAPDSQLGDLRSSLCAFAAKQQAFEVPRLAVARLGKFLALVLPDRSREFSELSSGCVRDFDAFRAPATEEELAARWHSSFSSREQQNLARWGYPYVLDTWKFHMTLTCSLQPGPGYVFQQHLVQRFAQPCSEPLCVESICLFEEPSAGANFRLVERFRLGKG